VSLAKLVSYLKLGVTFDTSRTENNSVENMLSVSHLKRSDLHSEFTCRVSNNNISSPISHTVHLDMNCEQLILVTKPKTW
jgi:hypothetical protein